MEHTHLTFKGTKSFTMYPKCSQFKESPREIAWVSITNTLVKVSLLLQFLPGFSICLLRSIDQHLESGELLPNSISKSLRII